MPGVEFVKDSGAGGAGVYWFPTLMNPKVERSYAGNSHYSNLNRPNYHLMVETPVRRILLNGTTATGVEFSTNDGVATVKATREVLVAAGAIHTPKVLMLSGIGPRKAIEANGLKAVVDLPGVGQNFQDHANVGAAIALPGLKQIHPNANDLADGGDAEFKQWSDAVWAANRTGPQSIAFGNIAGWLPLTVISPDRYDALASELESQDHAAYLGDVDPTVAAGYAVQMKGLAAAMRSKDTVFARYAVDATNGATAPILNQPFSRGSVTLDPKDPFGALPLVDYRALSNPIEVAVAVEIVKWYRRFHFDTSLAALTPNETAPGADANAVTDEQIAAWLATAWVPTDYHPAGTAALLPLELGGVVDTTLRVYGVENLRVIDASIMPSLPGGNTCQPTYAIAEKAADIIKSRV